MKKQEQKKKSEPMEKAMALTNLKSSQTDPSGSYTGRPADPGEIPVQDADDL